MKKSLLLILASLFAIFALAGCAEDSKNDTPATTVTTPVAGNIDSMVGTYTVDFFGTDAMIGYITTDCDRAATLGYAYKGNDPDGKLKNCYQYGENSNATMYGSQVTMAKDANGNLVVKSKMQLYHIMMSASEGDTYQYVEYTAIPSNNVTANGINTGSTAEGAVIGVSGRNLTAYTSNPETTFDFIVQENGTVLNNMLLKGKEVSIFPGMKVNADTKVILKKISNEVSEIEPNKLFEPTVDNETANEIFSKFVENIQ